MKRFPCLLLGMIFALMASGETRLSALWRTTGKLNPPECRVEEANFKIDKDYGIKMEPVITNLLSRCTNSPCIHRRYRFEAETNSKFRVRWVV